MDTHYGIFDRQDGRGLVYYRRRLEDGCMQPGPLSTIAPYLVLVM